MARRLCRRALQSREWLREHPAPRVLQAQRLEPQVPPVPPVPQARERRALRAP
jgi:hypothetical protein